MYPDPPQNSSGVPEHICSQLLSGTNWLSPFKPLPPPAPLTAPTGLPPAEMAVEVLLRKVQRGEGQRVGRADEQAVAGFVRQRGP